MFLPMRFSGIQGSKVYLISLSFLILSFIKCFSSSYPSSHSPASASLIIISALVSCAVASCLDLDQSTDLWLANCLNDTDMNFSHDHAYVETHISFFAFWCEWSFWTFIVCVLWKFRNYSGTSSDVQIDISGIKDFCFNFLQFLSFLHSHRPLSYLLSFPSVLVGVICTTESFNFLHWCRVLQWSNWLRC